MLVFFVTLLSANRSQGDKTSMCDSDSLSILQSILDSLTAQQYESGGVFTIGGIAGTYMIKSPFNTECEYCILSVSSSNGTAGSYALSSSNPAIIAPTATSPNFGAVATGGEGNPFEGVTGWVNSTQPVTYPDIWLPMGRGAFIYMAALPGASNSIMAQIAFRRSLVHSIPSVPRQHSQTHSMVASRRQIRQEQGLSKQYSGFDAQYPDREGGHEYYMHNDLPYSEDPQNNNPLTPGGNIRRTRRGH